MDVALHSNAVGASRSMANAQRFGAQDADGTGFSGDLAIDQELVRDGRAGGGHDGHGGL